MGQWSLDGTHLDIGFSVRHMMVANVKGRFTAAQAQIQIDEEHPERSSLVAEIETASVDTRAADRDAHLRSADFFNSDEFPVMTFRSTDVRRTGPREIAIEGDLTIRDVTKPITLKGVLDGPVADPWGNRRAGVEVTGEIDREAWGLGWNVALEAGGVLVGKQAKFAIEAEIV
ncbi:MAG: YceI family protein, partial [Chloroflexi bacterium]|nr:YceI family protein [Chloroflexota bacterium]